MNVLHGVSILLLPTSCFSSSHFLSFSFCLAPDLVTSILHGDFQASSLTVRDVISFATDSVSISGRFLTSWRALVLLWNLLALIHDVIIDAVLAPGTPDLKWKNLITVMMRLLPCHPPTHHPALRSHAAFQIHHHTPTPCGRFFSTQHPHFHPTLKPWTSFHSFTIQSTFSSHSTRTSFRPILPTTTRPSTTPTFSTFSTTSTCHGPTAPQSIWTTTTSQTHFTNDTFTTCTTP